MGRKRSLSPFVRSWLIWLTNMVSVPKKGNGMNVEFANKSNQNKDEVYEEVKCRRCHRIPSEAQRKYSMDKFGQILCFGHQPNRRDE